MCKEFLTLNRRKIEFGLKATSLIFVSLVLIAFGWGWFNGKVPEWSLFVTVLLVAGVFFPAFCMTLGILAGFQEYKRIKSAFNQYPFSELLKNGLGILLIDQDTHWRFTQLVVRGIFAGYPMTCFVENGIIRIVALVDRNIFKKEHMLELKEQFGKGKIEYDGFGIAIRYNINKEKSTSYEQLKSDLEQFAQFFIKNELPSWEGIYED